MYMCEKARSSCRERGVKIDLFMPPANGINCIHQLLYQLLHAYSDIVYSIQIAFHSIVVRLAMLGAAANVVSQIVYQRTSDSVWCTNSVTV